VMHLGDGSGGGSGGSVDLTSQVSIDAADTGNSTLPAPLSARGVGVGGGGGAASASGPLAQQAAFQASLLAAQQARLALQTAEIEAARERWNKYLVLHTKIDRHSSELRRLVRRGIPPELRGHVWQILSGSRDKQALLQAAHLRRFRAQQSHSSESLTGPSAESQQPLLPTRDHILDANYYAHCLACATNPANLTADNHPAQVEKDLHRTFPDNMLYESNPVPGAAAADAAAAPAAAAASSAPSASSASSDSGAGGVGGVKHRHTSSVGLNMLRRVLLAFSFHCPAIGYCQSMNFITALLLLFMDEEEAFYMLCVILEDVCCIDVTPSSSGGSETAAAGVAGVAAQGGDDAAGAGDDDLDVAGSPSAVSAGGGSPSGGVRKLLYYHSPDLSGAHIDQKVFADLVAEKLPRVAAHFERLSFPLAPLAMAWHLCLFVNTLPLETVLVVWDVLFSEGVKILLRASLTLLKVHEKHILRAADFEELLMVLKTLPAFHPTLVQQGEGGDQPPTLVPPLVDTAGFMKIAFDPMWIGSFPLSKITALRNFHRLQVEEDLAMRKSKAKAAKERIRAAQAAAAVAAAAAAAAQSKHASSNSTTAQQQQQHPPPPPPRPSVAALSSSPAASLHYVVVSSSPPRSGVASGAPSPATAAGFDMVPVQPTPPSSSSSSLASSLLVADPARVERLSLYSDAVAHGPTILESYYSPEGVGGRTKQGGAASEGFLPVFPPAHGNDSPRVGPAIQIDEESPAPSPPVSAKAAPHRASATPSGMGAALAASAGSVSRPARPSESAVKQALKHQLGSSPSGTAQSVTIHAAQSLHMADTIARTLAASNNGAGAPSAAGSNASGAAQKSSSAVPPSAQARRRSSGAGLSTGASASRGGSGSAGNGASESSASTGVFAGLLSSVGRAIEFLVEDERAMEQRRQEARSNSSNSSGSSGAATPEKRRGVQGAQPPQQRRPSLGSGSVPGGSKQPVASGAPAAASPQVGGRQLGSGAPAPSPRPPPPPPQLKLV